MVLVVHWGKCGLVSGNAPPPFWQSAILASELKKPLPFWHRIACHFVMPHLVASLKRYYLVLLFLVLFCYISTLASSNMPYWHGILSFYNAIILSDYIY